MAKMSAKSAEIITVPSMSLIDRYRDSMRKQQNMGVEAAPVMMFRSGLDVLDFRLGYRDYTTGLPRIGIPCGRILYIASPSGTGKSTLAAQICRSLMIQYPGLGFSNFMENENSMSYQRMCSLEPFQIPMNECIRHFVLTNRGVYTETFENSIREMHKMKLEMYAKGVRVPVTDSYGTQLMNPITGDPEYMPPPTIVVLDSLWGLAPLEFQQITGDEGTNMDNARIVAANSTVIRKIIGLLEEANIMLVIVNHIRKKINTSRFPTPAQLNYLKQDEYLPGGDVPIYSARTLGKLIAGEKIKGDDENCKIKYGIDGYVVTWLTLKSMASRSGLECQLIYDPVRGYDNDLSNLHFLRTMKLLDGNGWYQVPGSTRKFTFKNFKQVIWEDRQFALAFQSHVWHNLMAIIPTSGQSRFVDMYSNRVAEDNVGVIDIQQDKLKAALSEQLVEDELLQFDHGAQRWYAKHVGSGTTRWLAELAVA